MPGPGVLLPDLPLTLGDGTRSRLRAIARDGLLLLHGEDTDVRELQSLASSVVRAPVGIRPMAAVDIAGLDAERFAASSREVWIVRPDAYVAAVADWSDKKTVEAAMRAAISA